MTGSGRPRLAFGLLVRDGRLLLVHRRHDRLDFPDTWDLPGGHLEPGETPEEALIREVGEEVGVRVTRFAQVAFPDFFPAAETHVFRVTGWAGEPANVAVHEHDDLRWFNSDEMTELRMADDRFRDWLRALVCGA